MTAEAMPSAESPRSRTTAVITAYYPGEHLERIVASALSQCREVVVVDNTPSGDHGVELDLRGAIILSPERNLGLAAALTLGINAATADQLLLLDQDSTLPDGLVEQLDSVLRSADDVGAASPAAWDIDAGRYVDPRAARRPEVAAMTSVMTSGMLLRRAAYASTPGLPEDFFVDCVDQALCLELRAAGWRVLQDRRLLLPHRLGEMRWHRVGPLVLRATHHPRWRLYWAGRNGVILTRRALRSDVRWATVNAAQMAYWLLSILLFEPPRARRAGTFLRGVLDGLLSRRDPDRLPPSAR